MTRPFLFWAVSFAVLLLLFALDITRGTISIPLDAVLSALMHRPAPEDSTFIVTNIRLPKIMTALLTGCALATGGLQMQSLFRNPLASPSILGISSGAALGVALFTLSEGATGALLVNLNAGSGQPSGWVLAGAACFGAGLVMSVILLLSLRTRSDTVLLISGVMVGNIMLAIVGVMQYFSRPDQIKEYLMWTFGSLSGVSGSQLVVLAVAVGISLLLAVAQVKPLNAFLLGEEYARSIGINVSKTRLIIIVSVSLAAGSVTAFCGPISFIGVAAPHMARALTGSADHRVLVPTACLCGMIIMLGCDLATLIPGGEGGLLPINLVTSLLGSPVVIWIIWNQHKKKFWQ